MPYTSQNTVVKAPIHEVWNRFSNFHELTWAAAILADVKKVGDKNGDEVGAQRILNDAFHETLTRLEPENYLVEYSIDDGPSPVSKEEVSHYIGTIQLSNAPDGDGTLVVWNSSWESNTDNAVEFCHGIYVALLDELVKSFQ